MLASSHTMHGLTVDRPDGWKFVEPDGSVAKDTVMMLIGPPGTRPVAPVVEFGRRALDAAAQRKGSAEVLSVVVAEIVATYDGFKTDGPPTEIDIAGYKGRRLTVDFTEVTIEGTDVLRHGRVFAFVTDADIWIIRCMGPADGSAAKDFDAVVASISVGSS